MARYLARMCPKCEEYCGVAVPEPKGRLHGEALIRAACLRYRFKLVGKMLQSPKSSVAGVRIILLALLFNALPAFPHPADLDSREAMLRQVLGQSYREPAGERKTEYRTVKRVVDGDTIVLENGEKVRLIGIDTLETKHPQEPVQQFGKEASAFVRRMVQGKQIRIEFDQGNSYLRHKDKYQRTLAYVFLMNRTFLNAEIIRQGYGFTYTQIPFKYLEEFRRLEREAREQRRGLWRKGS